MFGPGRPGTGGPILDTVEPERPAKLEVVATLVLSSLTVLVLSKLVNRFADYLRHQAELADDAEGRLALTRQQVQVARRELAAVRKDASTRIAHETQARPLPVPVDELDPDQD
jgi:hypothetical protein